MDPALRDATLAATNIQAPASPLGASSGPELAQLYASKFQLPQSNAAAGAAGNIAALKVKADEEAAKIVAKKEQDKADINAYKIVKKQDGGYDFFDPSGKQVDIATLTQRTGVKATDILKDSENPIDIQYRNDYSHLQDYVQAVLSKDKNKVEAYRAAQPGLAKYDDKGGIDRLIQQFKQSYQRYYTPNWGANVPTNPVVPTGLSQANAILGSSGGI